MEALVLIIAFVAGLVVRQAGYPPLLGYLAAGFCANAFGIGSSEALAPLADAGVMLLLFTIGLKLTLQSLAPVYVWGTAALHLVITVPLTVAVILIVGAFYAPLSFDAPEAAWALAFALSFSSTVFAIKMFDERGETKSFSSSIAVGILVVQDVMAVIYLVVMSGKYPSPWVFLLLGLPIFRVPLSYVLKKVGHGELLLFCGIVLAFAFAELVELFNLKAGLGALLAGMLVASADGVKAKEMYRAMADVKNLLLIGFIVQIGYYGIPSVAMLFVAAVLALLILIRPVIYFSLLTLFGLRARTGWLVGLSLFNYSEFGLIVAAAAVQSGILNTEWITTLALAMSISFVFATPLNKAAHELYRKYQNRLAHFEKPDRLEEESIGSLGGASVAILGMGRVGCGAYTALVDSGQKRVAGIEERYDQTQHLIDQGYRCVHGDASDRDFWEHSGLADTRIIFVSLSNHRENLAIVQLALDVHYQGTVVVAARFPDEQVQLEELGCVAVNLYQDVGREFVQSAINELGEQTHDKI